MNKKNRGQSCNNTVNLIPNFGAAQKDKWYGPLTLNKSMLKYFIKKLNHKIVLPVHFGTFTHYIEGKTELLSLNDSRILVLKEEEQIFL